MEGFKSWKTLASSQASVVCSMMKCAVRRVAAVGRNGWQ